MNKHRGEYRSIQGKHVPVERVVKVDGTEHRLYRQGWDDARAHEAETIWLYLGGGIGLGFLLATVLLSLFGEGI